MYSASNEWIVDGRVWMADEHLISLQPGTVIAGRYEVVKCLGAGSMGLVYACRHKELSGHLVAVKVLFPEVAQDKIAAARFRNEIFASYGVSHPNVVRAYEYIRDGDLVAYTMEYVGGGDLADRLGRPDALIPIPEVVRFLSQMCSGVQAIHDAGIVHRDLKPENILITKDGSVKIADFGIARSDHGPKLTEHGGVVGTIDYVSPEYMLNSQVDWRSDIYAIGILGYEMVTGESPFRGDSVYATMTKRLKSDPKSPSALRPECPPELDRIILRAMHRDPGMRYQSMADMFYDLQSLVPGQSISSGAYLQISKHSSGNYVGPQVAPTPDSQLANDETLTEVNPAPVEHMTDQAATRAFVPKVAPARKSDASFPHVVNGNARPQHDPYETRVVQGRDVDAAVEEDTTVEEPVRMERVLAYKDLVSEGWEGAAVSPEVQATRGVIDPNRVSRLSRMNEKESNSIWLDVVTVIVAVVIGVGVGVVFIKIFLPDLFSRSSASGPRPVLEETVE